MGLFVQYTFAQTWTGQPIWIDSLAYPEVGKPMPNELIHNIHYFKKKQASIEDFKGKWLILDFWNTGCTACVASFPHVNEEMKEFKDKISFMLIGRQDIENKIPAMYERFRQKERLEMPCAYDSIICKRFNIWAGPTIIIIDPKGIVRGYTYSLTERQI